MRCNDVIAPPLLFLGVFLGVFAAGLYLGRHRPWSDRLCGIAGSLAFGLALAAVWSHNLEAAALALLAAAVGWGQVKRAG